MNPRDGEKDRNVATMKLEKGIIISDVRTGPKMKWIGDHIELATRSSSATSAENCMGARGVVMMMNFEFIELCYSKYDVYSIDRPATRSGGYPSSRFDNIGSLKDPVRSWSF